MKKCPFCAEEIQDEAIVCRWCGRDLPPKIQVQPKSKSTDLKKTPVKRKSNNFPIALSIAFTLAFCISIGIFNYRLNKSGNLADAFLGAFTSQIIYCLLFTGIIVIIQRVLRSPNRSKIIGAVIILASIGGLLLWFINRSNTFTPSQPNTSLGGIQPTTNQDEELNRLRTQIAATPESQSPTPTKKIPRPTSTVEPDCIPWYETTEEHINKHICIYVDSVFISQGYITVEKWKQGEKITEDLPTGEWFIKFPNSHFESNVGDVCANLTPLIKCGSRLDLPYLAFDPYSKPRFNCAKVWIWIRPNSSLPAGDIDLITEKIAPCQ